MGEIEENVRRIHTGKNGGQRCLISNNWRPKCWNRMKTFFGGHRKRRYSWSVREEIVVQTSSGKDAHKELPKNVSGRFGEIRAKMFRTLKNMSSPTPMQGTSKIRCFVSYSECLICDQTVAQSTYTWILLSLSGKRAVQYFRVVKESRDI